MESPVPIRLACRIPSGAKSHLAKSIIRRSSRKGKTLEYLMELARDNSDHPIFTFDNDGKPEPCTLNASETWLKTFQDYREKYGIYQNTLLFHDTLLRGISVEMNSGNNTTDNAKPDISQSENAEIEVQQAAETPKDHTISDITKQE